MKQEDCASIIEQASSTDLSLHKFLAYLIGDSSMQRVHCWPLEWTRNIRSVLPDSKLRLTCFRWTKNKSARNLKPTRWSQTHPSCSSCLAWIFSLLLWLPKFICSCYMSLKQWWPQQQQQLVAARISPAQLSIDNRPNLLNSFFLTAQPDEKQTPS